MKLRVAVCWAAGLILIAFGLACVNYTKPSGLEHHRAWAETNAALPPSDGILFGGVLAIVSGALLIGAGPSCCRTQRNRSPGATF